MRLEEWKPFVSDPKIVDIFHQVDKIYMNISTLRSTFALRISSQSAGLVMFFVVHYRNLHRYLLNSVMDEERGQIKIWNDIVKRDLE